MGSVTDAGVWVDEGHGRIGVLDPAIFPGLAALTVSVNDGRCIGGWIDDQYQPASVAALAMPAVETLEGGQRVFFRAETTRNTGAPADVPIAELDERDVTRSFVILTVLPDGVDDPPERPQPKTRPVPNEDMPAPPVTPARARRWAPSHRDGWEYNAIVGGVTHAYKYNDGVFADDPKAVHYLAKAMIVAADLAQGALEGHVDRTKYSHQRARRVVHVVIERHAPPCDTDPAITRGWIVGVALQAVQLCRIADGLCSEAS